ncbi:MAG TPA: hypothetical protein IGS53_02695 [Leptolyngbyaceae cyanobacterium M33_DOE_097]|uniref:Uncharacterized protein n=1 Tax=Oscillatoriales cyanobacterium SpSt-418 TaxID=2282169 RepID=A0A7C3PHX6_9CYAN|nr:hypothetical protein [Leptolyngbyaceae cyanobacterium M33_DOE_097]
MTLPHPPRYRSAKRRSSQLAAVVLPDESTAFQLYRLLQQHGISPENLAIVGKGYNSAEQVGLLRPAELIRRRAVSLGLHSLIIGAILSGGALLIWDLAINPYLLVGLTGFFCSLVGVLTGIVLGAWGEGGIASLYHYHLSKGRYLLLIEGPATIVSWGREVLRQYTTPSLRR